jgi:hypothetical protein
MRPSFEIVLWRDSPALGRNFSRCWPRSLALIDEIGSRFRTVGNDARDLVPFVQARGARRTHAVASDSGHAAKERAFAGSGSI